MVNLYINTNQMADGMGDYVSWCKWDVNLPILIFFSNRVRRETVLQCWMLTRSLTHTLNHVFHYKDNKPLIICIQTNETGMCHYRNGVLCPSHTVANPLAIQWECWRYVQYGCESESWRIKMLLGWIIYWTTNQLESIRFKLRMTENQVELRIMN